MSDILNQIVAVKHEEVAAAQKRLPLAAMRADAESRVLTRATGRRDARKNRQGPGSGDRRDQEKPARARA